MSKTYFLRDSGGDLTCDGPNANLPLSETQGVSAQWTSDTVSSSTFIDIGRFKIIDADIPQSGVQDIDYSIEVTSATDIEYRFHVVLVDSSGCAIPGLSDVTANFTGTGIKTGTLSPISGAGADQLQLRVEIARADGAHGNKFIALQANDADTTLLVPWSAVPATGVLPSLSLTGVGA
jgi:hypothetical protein